MVQLKWHSNEGEGTAWIINCACGENDRAEYGKRLLERLSSQLTAEFGKDFSVQGLRNMRQIHTMYYQRILASHNKALVAAKIQTTEPKPEYEKIVKDPYVMEFLQIQPDTHVYEGELEQAMINHLQHFQLLSIYKVSQNGFLCLHG